MEDTGSMMFREKPLVQGVSSLTDVELLAPFLRTGMQGKDVPMLVKEMLQHFELLYGLLSANCMDSSYARGIGIAKYAQLKGIAELTGRYYKV